MWQSGNRNAHAHNDRKAFTEMHDRGVMKKNVIILTSGLSGSSLLTGFIVRGGYWAGNTTFHKPDYHTFENQELISLNKRLFDEAGYKGNYTAEFSSEALTRIAGLFRRDDCDEYRTFLKRCDEHQPWIWKDPRLWMTIRFWKNLLDLDRCVFILLTRDLREAWISSLLRRQVMTYRYARDYEGQINRSLVDFLRESNLPYLHMNYEELIERPVEAIARLNAHLDSTLTLDDLKATYNGILYKAPKYSLWRKSKAILIYLKNYSERLDLEGAK